MVAEKLLAELLAACDDCIRATSGSAEIYKKEFDGAHRRKSEAMEKARRHLANRSTQNDPDPALAEYQHIKAQQHTADYSDQCSSDLPF